MTDLEKFNLLWLCHAMTAPVKCDVHYYYDGQTRRFFYTKPDETGNGNLYDMVDLTIADDVSKELLLKVNNMDAESSEIVEIPRLNVQDKVAVQLLFLSKFPGIHHEEDLRIAAEKQADKYGFVLDIITNEYDVLAPLEPYWEDFKLKTIQYYLEKFTGVIGITLRMIT